MNKKMKLRPYVFPMLYMIVVLVLLGAVYYNGLINNSYKTGEKDSLTYVTNLELYDDSILVSKKEEIMVKPFISESVSIGKNYYNYQDGKDKQENSIVYYEGTYIQNSGVDYVSKEKFDIVSCLNGTVLSVQKTELMGYVVEIKYDNDIIISYQSLSEVTVKENDSVVKGQTIGISGKSTIGSELGNHLHLEMYLSGQTVNPEDYYNKNIKDI
ncbi:MAG: M23 family metallopeptidase [Firmicutes bacterium]|nr:M23 family metallopeptidase [Bacillota bacterium]